MRSLLKTDAPMFLPTRLSLLSPLLLFLLTGWLPFQMVFCFFASLVIFHWILDIVILHCWWLDFVILFVNSVDLYSSTEWSCLGSTGFLPHSWALLWWIQSSLQFQDLPDSPFWGLWVGGCFYSRYGPWTIPSPGELWQVCSLLCLGDSFTSDSFLLW